MKKIFYAAVSLLISVLMLASCGSNIPAQTTQSDTTRTSEASTEVMTVPEPLLPTEKTFFPEKNIVKHIGRTMTENDTLWLAHSASGIEFTFRGSEASIDIVGDSASKGSIDSQARFAVYVNGERTLDEMVNESEKTYTVFKSDVAEDVTIKLLKLSEAGNSSFGIKSITVVSDGIVSPTPEKDLKIEFIGDSLTCAYGVDDEDKNHHFSTTTEDATKSYAYKTAQKLDADYNLVCFSGHGIISGYTSGNKNTFQLVPAIYEQFTNTSSAKNYCTIDAAWDFSSFDPDYIVINLGTNDNSYTKGAPSKIEEFTAEYAEFLKMVRKDNPEAHIICTLGISGAELLPAIQDAVSRYSAETDDKNISTFRFSVQDGVANGFAADWHPTEKSHQFAADELTGYIKYLIRNSEPDDTDYSVPVNIELDCEFNDEDRMVQEFLTSTRADIDTFCDLLFYGESYGGKSTQIKKAFADSYDPEFEHIFDMQYSDMFTCTADMRDFMKKYFSEELFETQCGLLLDGWYSDGEYVPPRFIDVNSRLYREEGVSNRELIMDYNTAKVIARNGDTVIYTCIGRGPLVVQEYRALYGMLKYDNGELKYGVLPWRTYEYNSSVCGDAKEIYGI